MKTGIIGGAGYTAGELLRLLINHPRAEIVFVHSASCAGKPVAEIHEGLAGETDLKFSGTYDLESIDILFLCAGHGYSRKFWAENRKPRHLKVIDLAQDYRDETQGYVYGLPELNLNRIKGAEKIANPGCFATAIQLSLLPLANAGLIVGDVQISAITGSTGAGVKPGSTTHFSWRSNNVSVYKAFTHQHLDEINRNLHALQPSFCGRVNFVPVRGDFARGIFVSCWLDCSLGIEEVYRLFEDYYHDSPFTIVSRLPVDLKQVVNTNKAMISLQVSEGRLLVTTAIDNLLKGASGQAVENMNLLFGLDRAAGLRLKASAF